MSIKCNSQELLQRAGIIHTRHRELVLNVFMRQAKALTVKTILTEIRQTYNMDKVTLYRILEHFVSKKILRRLTGSQASMAFEIIGTEQHPAHPHFICRHCGDMECLHDIDMPLIERALKQAPDHQQTTMDLKLEGICPQCQERPSHA